ncbi:hypothetical protein DPSP01_006874 [Paraphaeosphaeria sporulosa]
MSLLSQNSLPTYSFLKHTKPLSAPKPSEPTPALATASNSAPPLHPAYPSSNASSPTVRYDPFRDRETFRGTFLKPDTLDEDAKGGLKGLKGKLHIIWTASVLHLWVWARQELVLAGRMMGFSVAGEYVCKSKGIQESFYRHNGDSFGKLFREASAGFDGWVVEVEAPAWKETLKIRTAEELGTIWNLQIKFVARRASSKMGD